MKSVKILIVFLIFSCFCLAHEVPPMTKYELAEKNAARSRIKQAKIKSISRWKYTVADSVATDKKEKTLQQDFDGRGNLIRIAAFKNNLISEEVRFTFNDKNQMLTDTDYEAAGNMTEQIKYEYLANGLPKSGVKSDGKGNPKEMIVYTYSPDKIIVEKKSNDGGILQKTIYSYQKSSDNFDYTGAQQFDEKNTLQISVIQNYNDKKQLTEKHVNYPDDGKSYVWLYTNFNKENRWQRIGKQAKNGAIDWFDDYSYDQYGNPVEIKRFNRDNKLIGYTKMTFESF